MGRCGRLRHRCGTRSRMRRARKLVYQRTGAIDLAATEKLAGGVRKMRIGLPELPPGWYEASLLITSRGREIARQVTNIVLLADGGGSAVAVDPANPAASTRP